MHDLKTLNCVFLVFPVCPTTLKRICRQYGIARWPSRKINKVSRSLKKIQSVLDSVEGVGGGLRFDPTTGGVVAASSLLQALDHRNIVLPSKTPITSCMGIETTRVKKEEACLLDGNQEADVNLKDTNDSCQGVEHNQRVSSGMTDSSNGSGTGSMMKGSSSSSHSFRKRQNPITEGESKVTIKATYKEDTFRFKLEAAGGCIQLYEVVAERFNLHTGQFQLRYVDDEDEWVMLASDSDFLECLEISDLMGRRSVKIMVRDMPSASGSSTGSSGFLGHGLYD